MKNMKNYLKISSSKNYLKRYLMLTSYNKSMFKLTYYTSEQR